MHRYALLSLLPAALGYVLPDSAPTTLVPAPTPASLGARAVTTTLPRSAGAVTTSKPITVGAGQSFDGGMKNYDRSRTFGPW